MPTKSRKGLEREIREVEGFEYLLVEYLKEISNEMTYLVLVVAALFLFVIIDIVPSVIPTPITDSYQMIKLVFVLLVVGGFALFGLSNITKRRIEKRFAKILYK